VSLAFSDTRLKSIVVPASVEVIDTHAFSECESLESVVFQTGSVLQKIGEDAFQLSRLKNLVIPALVEVIAKITFFGCDSLESMTFESGSGLREIGESAFVASRLKSIGIPASVEVIREEAFDVSESLELVTFQAGSVLREVGYRVFAGNVFHETRSKTIVVPASVGVIGKHVFSWGGVLDSMTFEPGSMLREIGESGFVAAD
jgi:hypothetical protein